jgi:hypothetical protein
MLKQSLLQCQDSKIAVAGEPRLAGMSIGCPQQNAVTGFDTMRCGSLDLCQKQTSSGDFIQYNILQLLMGNTYFEGSLRNRNMRLLGSTKRNYWESFYMSGANHIVQNNVRLLLINTRKDRNGKMECITVTWI